MSYKINQYKQLPLAAVFKYGVFGYRKAFDIDKIEKRHNEKPKLEPHDCSTRFVQKIDAPARDVFLGPTILQKVQYQVTTELAIPQKNRFFKSLWMQHSQQILPELCFESQPRTDQKPTYRRMGSIFQLFRNLIQKLNRGILVEVERILERE